MKVEKRTEKRPRVCKKSKKGQGGRWRKGKGERFQNFKQGNPTGRREEGLSHEFAARRKALKKDKGKTKTNLKFTKLGGKRKS